MAGVRPIQFFPFFTPFEGLPTPFGPSGYHLQSAGVGATPTWAPFQPSGTGAVARTWQNKLAEAAVSVADFGAVGDGSTDDTNAIQNAITSLPPNGGDVLFLAGKNYKITSTLNVGNGSSSASPSTTNGVRLLGQANSQGNTGAFRPQLLWAGATNVNMIAFNGPYTGGGLRNLVLNGNGSCAFGLKYSAISNSEVDNVTLEGFTNTCLAAATLVSGVGAFPTTSYNAFRNITMFPAAGAIGLFLDGNGTDTTTSCSFNLFQTLFILMTSSALSQQAYYLKNAANNNFVNCSTFGGGASTSGLVFDYSAPGSSGVFPANNNFFGFNNNVNAAGGTLYTNVSTPGSSARPNRIYAIADSNAEQYPKIANTAYNAEIINAGVDITGQTTSVGNTNILPYVAPAAGMYRVSFYLEITTVGNNVNVSMGLVWNDDTGSGQTFASSLIAANAKNFTQGNLTIRVASGNQIVYNTTVSGAIGAGLYALHIKIEKLD